MTKFAQPTTTQEALAHLTGDQWSMVAGGTDFYPALGSAPVTKNVLDLSKLTELRTITDDETHWQIGALATWTDVINSKLPPAFNALKLAAREVGSVQIQNRATVAGNLCNASPAADGMPALLCLDAIVRVSSESRTRDIALKDFVTGNRQTTLTEDEMVVGLLVPKASATGQSSFIKLGSRKYLVISIAMVATRLCVDSEQRITDAAISVGSCSVVAQRLTLLEQALTGQPLTTELADKVNEGHIKALTPIDDIRATASYRLESSVELVRRSIDSLVGQL